jgi:hypothetical protein
MRRSVFVILCVVLELHGGAGFNSLDWHILKLGVLLIQVNYLVLTSQLLIDMKRKELLFKARQRARQTEGAATEDARQQKGSKKGN